MTVIDVTNLSHEDAVALGLADCAMEDREVFIHPAKTTTGTDSQWADPLADASEADIVAAWREARVERLRAAGGDRRKLARLFAEHMDRVRDRIMALPPDQRLDAVRRWKRLTGERCPRGVTLRG